MSGEVTAEEPLRTHVIQEVRQAFEPAVLHVIVEWPGNGLAVVDCSGLPAAFVRLPGAPLHSIDIAKDKAYTAVGFGLPTSRWHKALESHSEAVRQGIPLRPRFVGFGGGLPIVINGQRVGGIGVSGGSEEEDEIIARAGLRALGLA